MSNDATTTTIDRSSSTSIRPQHQPGRRVTRRAFSLLIAFALVGTVGATLAPSQASARSGGLLEVGQRVFVDTDLLNLRTGQGTGADIIDTLPYGTQATVIGLPATGSDDGYDWYQIETDDGLVGWVAGAFLGLSDGGGDGGGGVFLPYGSVAIVDTDGLNLRDDWGLGAGVIDTLPYGTEVVIDSKPYNGDGYTWYAVYVSSTGAYGWVAGELLSLSGPTGEIQVGDLVSVATDALNIRSGPGLDAPVLDTLITGFQASVTEGPIYADGYTWYEISTSAITGWVAGEFLMVN